MAESPLTSDFKKFNPELYIQTYGAKNIEQMTRKSVALFKFNLDKLHTIFNSGVVKGRRLLDIGTGPNLQTVISASENVQEIYLSDISTANLNILREWWMHGRDLDYTSFEYVARKEAKECTVEDKQNHLRSKVEGILPIDIFRAKPFGEGVDMEKFDIIVSKLCLESATNTVEEYRRCVNNIMSLVCPGGFLVIAGVTGGTYYWVGDVRFAANPIGQTEIIRAFSDSGANVQQYEEEEDLLNDCYHDFKNKFVLIAKKK